MKVLLSTSATIKNIKMLVDDALKAQRITVANYETQKNNPSVAKDYHEAVGRVEALEAVHDAIGGNGVIIKLMGK